MNYASRFTPHASRLTASLIFIAALALYLRTACPTLGGGWDSEEFQYVAYTLGIAHSTGYPLYLILGKIFTTLVPIGNVAYRMNLLSAILTALAVVFVYLNARLLTQHQLAAIATAALFTTNAAVWRQAGVASVGPLNLLLLSALAYALLLWHARRAPLTIAAFIFGLGLAHHRTILFLAPAIAIFILLSDLNRRLKSRQQGHEDCLRSLSQPTEVGFVPLLQQFSTAWSTLFWLALPLAFYLYIPIFGSAEGFFNYVMGSEAGNYTRGNWLELGQAFVSILQYLSDSFGVSGIALIGIGAASILPRFNRAQPRPTDTCVALFFGLGALTYLAFATLVSGEPDRYLVLPFAFLIYWFALGVSAAQDVIASTFAPLSVNSAKQSPIHGMEIASARKTRLAMTLGFALVLLLFLALPFADRFRVADWSAFDRVYKQWDEIFTLPIPQNATIVGNWGQLNAMRYLQRVEQRRPDVQAIGTLYDLAPQTDAARAAFADGRAIFLAPGIVQPIGDYRYAQLGPLLQVRDQPQMQPPATQKNIVINPALTLANYEITTALEPYAPTTNIAPTRSARVTLDWQASDSVKDFLVRVRLYDPDGRAIAQRDELPVRGLYPASQWSRGEYVRDVHNIQIPGGTPPGTYQLKLQTLNAATQSPTSDEIALGSFAVERATNLTREQVFIQHPLEIALDDHVSLWGYSGFEGPRHAGEEMTISLVWHINEPIANPCCYLVQFKLRDPKGNWSNLGGSPLIGFYSVEKWQKGEALKAYYDIQLPVDAQGVLYLEAGRSLSDSRPIAEIQIAP